MERPITEHFPESPPTRPVPLDRWLIQVGARMRERFARAYDWLIGLRRVDRRRLLKRWRVSLAMLALLIATSGMPLPAHAATMTVTFNADGIANPKADDGKCSLAEAIINANNNSQLYSSPGECPAGSGADIITLSANATLNYASALASDANSALPDISSQITLQGNGSTIQRSGASTNFRILHVTNTGDLTLNLTTISGGNLTDGASPGAGIYVQGNLTLTNSTISGNVTNNSNGGGLALVNSGTSNITHSTISGNRANNGGGLYDYSLLPSSLTIANSTISGNTARRGGGLRLYGSNLSVTLENCTITSNTVSPYGGGGINLAYTHLTLTRTIISGNSGNTSLGYRNEIDNNNTLSVITADSHNLFGHSGENNDQAFLRFTPGASDINATSDGDGSSIHISTTLASILNTTLANNGGPTFTHNLVSGSPAIDKATGDSCKDPPVNGRDQRHKVRAAGAGLTCDIGAVEFNAPTAVTLSSFHASAPPINLWQWLTHMWQR